MLNPTCTPTIPPLNGGVPILMPEDAAGSLYRFDSPTSVAAALLTSGEQEEKPMDYQAERWKGPFPPVTSKRTSQEEMWLTPQQISQQSTPTSSTSLIQTIIPRSQSTNTQGKYVPHFSVCSIMMCV